MTHTHIMIHTLHGTRHTTHTHRDRDAGCVAFAFAPPSS